MEESYLREMCDELDALEEMTEAEVCRHYKCDSKAEVKPYIVDWYYMMYSEERDVYEDYLQQIKNKTS
jgi:ribosomal protein S19E (S16A)